MWVWLSGCVCEWQCARRRGRDGGRAAVWLHGGVCGQPAPPEPGVAVASEDAVSARASNKEMTVEGCSTLQTASTEKNL